MSQIQSNVGRSESAQYRKSGGSNQQHQFSGPAHAVQYGTSQQQLPHAPGDASNPFLLQFGSISPGFMNAMQVPARTSSAPPNLDEQKRDQVCGSLLSSDSPGRSEVSFNCQNIRIS
ncbi:unnamed protein product [Fraxinus pennsylvanica]|uniref:Uncharacterized protein n=1 Tax=Fraxinus pennsylvanica TaxID=56036 RepID=A0AAD1ZAJ0_9LAMI|nr:unnamed protein product [Fraxinus pennsylvanica]